MRNILWFALVLLLGLLVFEPHLYAGTDAAQAVPPVPDLNLTKWLTGILLGLVSTDRVVAYLKARAKIWEDKLLAAAKREANAIGSLVQQKAIKGAEAFDRWMSNIETWVTKQGKKLPAGPQRDRAIAVAHDVFQELHVFAEQVAHAAVDELAAATQKFQSAMPVLHRQIQSFPSGTTH